MPQPPEPFGILHFPVLRLDPGTYQLLDASAAALRLSCFLHHRFSTWSYRLDTLLRSSFRNLSRVHSVPRLKDTLYERALQLKGDNFLRWSADAFSATCLCFFSGEDNNNRDNPKDFSKSSSSEASSGTSFNGRNWTNILLATNVLVYVAQYATQGKLFLWGAKINSLIVKGQLWRLSTSSFLHANIMHLMVNCYSLNSIGPIVEDTSGPRRYLAVYFTSAIASSAMSYWFNKANSVGASGAVFGLVGSYTLFMLRHRSMFDGVDRGLRQIAIVIFSNMVIGLSFKGIDNWGHLGGFLGGIVTSWLVGPAWTYESQSVDGRRVVVDRPPISSLVGRKRGSR